MSENDIRLIKEYCQQCLLPNKTGNAKKRKEGLYDLATKINSHVLQKRITKECLDIMNTKGDSLWDYIVISSMIGVQTEWKSAKDSTSLTKKVAESFSSVIQGALSCEETVLTARSLPRVFEHILGMIDSENTDFVKIYRSIFTKLLMNPNYIQLLSSETFENFVTSIMLNLTNADNPETARLLNLLIKKFPNGIPMEIYSKLIIFIEKRFSNDFKPEPKTLRALIEIMAHIISVRNDGMKAVPIIRKHYTTLIDYAISELTNQSDSSRDVKDVMISALNAFLKVCTFGLMGGKIPQNDPFYDRLPIIFDLIVNDKILLLYFNRQHIKCALDDSWISTDAMNYLLLASSVVHYKEVIRFQFAGPNQATSSIIHRKKKQKLDHSPWETVLRNAFGVDSENAALSSSSAITVVEKPQWMFLLWILLRRFSHAIPTGPNGYLVSSLVTKLSRVIMNYASPTSILLQNLSLRCLMVLSSVHRLSEDAANDLKRHSENNFAPSSMSVSTLLVQQYSNIVASQRDYYQFFRVEGEDVTLNYWKQCFGILLDLVKGVPSVDSVSLALNLLSKIINLKLINRSSVLSFQSKLITLPFYNQYLCNTMSSLDVLHALLNSDDLILDECALVLGGSSISMEPMGVGDMPIGKSLFAQILYFMNMWLTKNLESRLSRIKIDELELMLVPISKLIKLLARIKSHNLDDNSIISKIEINEMPFYEILLLQDGNFLSQHLTNYLQTNYENENVLRDKTITVERRKALLKYLSSWAKLCLEGEQLRTTNEIGEEAAFGISLYISKVISMASLLISLQLKDLSNVLVKLYTVIQKQLPLVTNFSSHFLTCLNTLVPLVKSTTSYLNEIGDEAVQHEYDNVILIMFNYFKIVVSAGGGKEVSHSDNKKQIFLADSDDEEMDVIDLDDSVEAAKPVTALDDRNEISGTASGSSFSFATLPWRCFMLCCDIIGHAALNDERSGKLTEERISAAIPPPTSSSLYFPSYIVIHMIKILSITNQVSALEQISNFIQRYSQDYKALCSVLDLLKSLHSKTNYDKHQISRVYNIYKTIEKNLGINRTTSSEEVTALVGCGVEWFYTFVNTLEDDDEDCQIQDRLINWFSNDDPVVRCLSARCIKLFLDKWEDHKSIFETVVDQMKSKGGGVIVSLDFKLPFTEYYPYVILITEISRYSKILLGEMLFQLVSYSRKIDLQVFVSFSLNVIASSLGYQSIKYLLEDNIAYIIAKWIDAYVDVEGLLEGFGNFPSYLLDILSPSQFVIQFLNIIMAQTALIRNYERRKALFSIIAQLVSLFKDPRSEVSLKKLLVINLGYVIAWISPFGLSDPGTEDELFFKNTWDTWILELLGNVSQRERICSSNEIRRQVMHGFIDLASFEGFDSHENINQNQINNTIKFISKKIIVCDSLIQSAGPIDTVVRLFASLQATNNVGKKNRLVSLFTSIIDFLADENGSLTFVSHIQVLQSCLSVIIWILHTVSTDSSISSQKMALKGLNRILSTCCSSKKKNLFPAIDANQIFSGIINVMKGRTDIEKYSDFHVIVKDTLRLFHDNKLLKESLSDVDPLPVNITILNEVRLLQHKKLTENQTEENILSDSLKRFLKLHNAFDVPNCAYLESSLKSLYEIIKKHQKTLVISLRNTLKSSHSNLVNNTSSLIRVLITIISNTNNKNISPLIVKLCGQIIGEIGYIDPSIIQLSEENSDCYRNKGKIIPINHAIFIQLEKYLRNPSGKIVVIVVDTFRNILSTPIGKDAWVDFLDAYKSESYSRLDVLRSDETSIFAPLRKKSVTSLDYLSQELWIDFLEVEGFSKWSRFLTCKLCEHSQSLLFYNSIELCAVSDSFALFIFPYVLYDILSYNINECREQISVFVALLLQNENQNILRFIVEAVNLIREMHVKVWTTPKLNDEDKKFVACCVGQNFLYDIWLNIDYLLLASSALKCSMYYTAALFVELWCDSKFKKFALVDQSNSDENAFNDFSSLDVLPEQKKILLEAYEKLRLRDAIYGVQGGTSSRYQISLSESEGSALKTLSACDTIKRLGGTEKNEYDRVSSDKLVSSLINQGLYHIAQSYINGYNKDQASSEKLVDLENQIAWRSLEWDDSSGGGSGLDKARMAPISSNNKSDNFDYFLFNSIRLLNSGESTSFNSLIDRARQLCMDNIKRWSVTEGMQLMYPFFTQLHQIMDLEHSWHDRWTMNVDDENGDSFMQIEEVVELNTIRCSGLNNSLSSIEPILALQGVLLTTLNKPDLLIDHLYNVVCTALRVKDKGSTALHAMNQLKAVFLRREENGLNILKSFDPRASNLKKIDQILFNSQQELHWRSKEANVIWNLNQRDTALNMNKIIINLATKGHEVCQALKKDKSSFQFLFLKGTALLTTGKWLSDTQSQSSQGIVKEYLEPAVEILSSVKSVEDVMGKYISTEKLETNLQDKVGHAEFTLARYLDKLHLTMDAYFKSSEWRRWEATRNQLKEEVNSLNTKKMKGNEHLLRRKQTELESMLENDRDIKLVDTYRILALTHFIQALRETDIFDIQIVYRIVGIWFNNISNPTVNSLMKKMLPKVPSRKFIPLMYQIAARLGEGNENFQGVLHGLLHRIACEHPFHSIYQLIALTNGGMDGENKKKVTGNQKIDAAKNLLQAVKNTNSKVKFTCLEIEKCCNLYISVAKDSEKNKRSIMMARDSDNEKKSEKKAKKRVIVTSLDINELYDSNQFMKSIKSDYTAVPTIQHPVQLDLDYSKIVTINKYLPEIKVIPSGINMPLLVTCIASDGSQHKQLVKADDMRPDAVMEQVFEMVNTLLDENASTNGRKLNIRTFKVVPLSPKGGVLQWVENTTPIGSYLVGVGSKHYVHSAHYRYHPDEMTNSEARKLLDKIIVNREDSLDVREKNIESKRAAYKDIAQNFTPVFHHFFTERFPAPAYWFERRMAYIQSVAVNSMVGYIVGIGDRHNSNILIDNFTAEVIHIDFGITFEQGKTLPTPERVPFRLTRDVVDGFGITGTEGVFRRCCEETLEVLRLNTESIITILKAVVSDPLHRWTVSNMHKRQIVEDGEDEINEILYPEEDKEPIINSGDAERVLLRVRQKLQGYEDPDGDALGVIGQVDRLITEARDENNLALMFPGWAAWV